MTDIFDRFAFERSVLDRADHLRTDRPALAAGRDDALAAVFIGAQPLVDAECALRLIPLGAIDPAHIAYQVFIGTDAQRHFYAVALLQPFDAALPYQQTGDHFADLRANMAQIPARDADLAATGKSLLSWHDTHQFCANCGAATLPQRAGWMRHCNACGADHFPRTDPVVIMMVTDGDRTLLGRAPDWPAGFYSCLAGFVEPGETIEAAVRREVYEEAGIEVTAIDYVTSQPWPFPSSLMIGCSAQARTTKISIDPQELADAKWVSRTQLQDALDRGDPSLIPARKGSIAHYLILSWLGGA